MKVVILAAGRGKRMGEFTETTTKAMLPITTNTGGNGTTETKPMLEVTIEQFLSCGFNEFVIVVGYRKRDIIEYFGDGSKFGATIQYVTQHNICAGTANAVECSKYFFDYANSFDEFFLVFGDVVPTVKDIISTLIVWARDPEGAAMAVRTVEDPQRYGVVETNTSGNIVRIVEKSPNPPTNLINAGMYILPVEIFTHIKNTKLSQRGEYELTESIQYLIDSGISVRPAEVSGVKDIGTKEVYNSLKM